jgi:hypothetical protein
MGRESRQARRARERREQEKRHDGKRSPANTRWSMLVGLGFAAAAVLVLAVVLFSQNSGSASTTPTVVAVKPSAPVDGVGCTSTSSGEQTTYHVHVHLTMLVDGTAHYAPPYIGFSLNDCLYWLHTHKSDGVIHIEAPKTIKPKLAAFFKIWGEPISSTRVGPYQVKSGQHMRVIIDNRPYVGNPADILLKPHENITIEIGPPFQPQQNFVWGNL